MSPTGRSAALLAAIALAALVVGPLVAGLAALALVAVAIVDLQAVRAAPEVNRTVPHLLSRGVGAPLHVEVKAPDARRLDVRQPAPTALKLANAEGEGDLRTEVTAVRRGRHRLPALATRAEGPLGLAAWHHDAGAEEEVLVYPDMVAARRLAQLVREGRLADSELRGRGPLGSGTEFDSIREYRPDDDVRHINWRATARTGKPMTNQFRVERNRDVVFAVDCGRLMAAPLGDRNRLDVALDAVAAVALVADEVGDRCGAVAFDGELKRRVVPRRNGAEPVIRSLFDLETASTDSDYEAAFRALEGAKRSFVLVLSDLLDESAARPLLDAVPVLARRHAVVVASVTDPDLRAAVATEPRRSSDVYRAGVALDILGSRASAAARLRAAGADVVEALADDLPVACVRAYGQAKARGRA
ncbi:MAG: DUF58 domain-containing protein [Solirubrobacterales bacterium]